MTEELCIVNLLYSRAMARRRFFFSLLFFPNHTKHTQCVPLIYDYTSSSPSFVLFFFPSFTKHNNEDQIMQNERTKKKKKKPTKVYHFANHAARFLIFPDCIYTLCASPASFVFSAKRRRGIAFVLKYVHSGFEGLCKNY